MREEIIKIIRDALTAIKDPRFFNTERGYQGELLAEIRTKLLDNGWSDEIVEQEYQKRLKEHGVTFRPDLIIHIPFERGKFKTRSEGNFAVIQLKKTATQSKALEDYDKLSDICHKLDYSLGIFININSDKTYLEYYEGNYKDRFISFAVELSSNEVRIKEDDITS